MNISIPSGGAPILLLLLLVAVDARAQPTALDTLRLTSDEAVARARNTGIDAERLRLRIARARTGEAATGGFFPSFPELEFERRTDGPFSARGDGGWGIHLTQEIEIAGRYGLRRDAARASADVAELTARGEERELRAEVRIAHARLVAAQETVRLTEGLAELAGRLSDAATRGLAAGEIAELDRNTIAIELGRATLERADARRALDDARIELGLLIGLRSDAVIEAVAPARGAGEQVLAEARRADSLLASGGDALVATRPDMQAFARERERIGAERALATSKWLPNLRLGAGITSDATSFGVDDLSATEPVRSGFQGLHASDKMFEVRVGIGVPLPLGRLYDLGAGDRAVLDVDAALIDADSAALAARVRADLRRAVAGVRSAAAALAAYETDIAPLIERNTALLERGVAAGELGSMQVVAQGMQLLRVGEAAIAARLAFAVATAELERAIAP